MKSQNRTVLPESVAVVSIVAWPSFDPDARSKVHLPMHMLMPNSMSCCLVKFFGSQGYGAYHATVIDERWKVYT